MSDIPLKRFDRIIAIHMQLLSKRVITAQELANRFQVSLRTIYRDIRTLETSGVPIISEPGVGYSIMEGYRLPPVMFTKEEASSFVTAEKLMQQFTDKTLGAYYESAMLKVKSVLRNTEKDWISVLESQVHIHATTQLFNTDIPNALEVILEGIVEKKQLYLEYHPIHSETPMERSIEPVGLFHENNYWYVLAYCHLRSDYRQFRTDRIKAIHKTETSFTLAHGTLAEHRNKNKPTTTTKVRILVHKKVARYISSGKKYQGFVSEKVVGDAIEMTFMVSDLENTFSRWYIMFGDYAQILEPQRLKDRIREILRTLEKRLN